MARSAAPPPPQPLSLVQRGRRAVLYVLAVASLVLLLGTVALWAWGGNHRSGVSYATSHVQLGAMAFPDRLILRREVVSWTLPPGWERQQDNYATTMELDVGDQLRSEHSLFQFARIAARADVRYYASDSGKRGGYVSRTVTLWVPYWLLALLFLPLPLWIGTIHRRRQRRANRRARGLCPDCGYDLRATPGRCPECGAHPKRSVLARLKSLVTQEMGRAGIEPATHGFSVHCSTS